MGFDLETRPRWSVEDVTSCRLESPAPAKVTLIGAGLRLVPQPRIRVTTGLMSQLTP